MGKNKYREDMDALEGLFGQGLIAGIIGEVKSGKEATVFCCEADADAGVEYLAAKVYRQLDVRSFRNDAMYNPGRLRNTERRVARAIETKTRFGQQASFAKWVADEFETLRVLFDGGCAVPRPYLQTDRVIVMEYIGDGDGEPAPALSAVRLAEAEARRAFEDVLRNIEVALGCDRIHGDLSAYNVLYQDGTVRVIDFPQAVDARFNPNARDLLERDIENICGHFERYGIDADAYGIARGMWGRYARSEL